MRNQAPNTQQEEMQVMRIPRLSLFYHQFKRLPATGRIGQRSHY